MRSLFGGLLASLLCLWHQPRVASGLSMAQKLALLRNDCGEVCQTDGERGAKEEHGHFKTIRKNVDCETLFTSPILDVENLTGKPPRLSEVPEKVRSLYGYGGRVPVLDHYLNAYDGDKRKNFDPGENVWTQERLDKLRETFRREGTLHGGYGPETTKNISKAMSEHLSDHIKDGRVLVIGSESPWIEAMLLEFGAREVTTLEYGDIGSEVPEVRTVGPDAFKRMYLEGQASSFDAVVTFSSVEHSGLGRYWDGLNPWGDLITMARAWCATRPGGRALVGVPVDDKDAVGFNAARIYGPLQLSHLFANWNLVWTENVGKNLDLGDGTELLDAYRYQPVFVLEKGSKEEKCHP